ncbi:methyl-accepting chemotaxis protein [Natrialba swarupiae]|nr:methyl-accepting chemotaxis protein [Natrialba swarupiae]
MRYWMSSAFGSTDPPEESGSDTDSISAESGTPETPSQERSADGATTVDVSDWDTVGNGLVDPGGDVERPAEGSPFGHATAESIIVSYLRGSTDPIFVVDAEGNFTHSNRECRDLFGRVPGELIGTNLFEYDEADNSVMREVLDTGEAIQNLEGVVEVDDETVHVSRTFFPLFDAAGELAGAIEINRDVSERVAALDRQDTLEEYRAYQNEVIAAFERWTDRLSRGDFTVEPEIPEPDADHEEIREAYDRFSRMAADLSGAIEDVNDALVDTRHTAERLAEISDDLVDAGEETTTATAEIDDASDAVDEMASEQAEQATVAKEDVATLATAVEQISRNATRIEEHAATASNRTEEGVEDAETALERIREAMAASESNVEHVRGLEARMDAIGEMADLIADIADQTNLLALNANIQAAHADESGDGFGVVADEIKGLADESKASVAEIADDLEDLRSGIEETMTAIERSNRTVETGADAVDGVVDHIEEIETAVGKTDEEIRTISQAASEQAATTETVEEIVRDLSERSDEIETQMASVSTSIDRQIDTIERVVDVSETVDDMAAEMEATLAAFELETEEQGDIGS